MNLKKVERYFLVKFLGPGPRLTKKKKNLLGCGLTKDEKHCFIVLCCPLCRVTGAGYFFFFFRAISFRPHYESLCFFKYFLGLLRIYFICSIRFHVSKFYFISFFKDRRFKKREAINYLCGINFVGK
jgi:hypothetical protein